MLFMIIRVKNNMPLILDNLNLLILPEGERTLRGFRILNVYCLLVVNTPPPPHRKLCFQSSTEHSRVVSTLYGFVQFALFPMQVASISRPFYSSPYCRPIIILIYTASSAHILFVQDFFPVLLRKVVFFKVHLDGINTLALLITLFLVFLVCS